MQSRQKQGKKGMQRQGQSLLNRKIIAPEKLKILVLAGNDLLNQHLDFLPKCTHLIKLDLSHNHLTRIPEKTDLSSLHHLQVVFLHSNKLSSIESVRPLFRCEILTYLTYHHNPLQVNVKHEHEIVNNLPNLKLLNNRVVHVEERSEGIFSDRTPILADRDMLENWKSTENSEAYYIKVLNMQLQYIDNLWAFNNPIVIIQRALRHFLPPACSTPISRRTPSVASKQLEQKHNQSRNINRQIISINHPLKESFDSWKTFVSGLRQVKQCMKKCKKDEKIFDKSYMVLPLRDYHFQLRNMRVNEPILQFLRKIRRRIYERKMAHLFMMQIKLKKSLFAEQGMSFYDISGMKENNRIYYNRSQQHIIDNFLTHIAQNYNKREAIFDFSNFKIASHYNAVRLVDPQSYFNRYNNGKHLNSLCCLIWSSMKVVISRKRAVASSFKSGFIGIPQISYIRNRDKVLTPEEKQKSIEVFGRLQRFAANQYQSSLGYFQCQDQIVMRLLLRMIYYHNNNAIKFQVKQKQSKALSILENFDEPLIVYADNLLKRTCAAVTIQKTWRRYISNKHQSQTIYQKMKNNRAVLHIQRFFRDTIYRHRQNFSKRISRDLASLRSQTIIYPMSFYINIYHILGTKPKSILFKHIKFTRQGRQVGINEQFYRPLFQQQIREKYFDSQRLGTENFRMEVDLYNLLHYNVQIAILYRNQQKYVSLTFNSQKQANIVAAIISLLSYQLWGSYYIKPLNKQKPNQWDQRVEQYYKIKKFKPYLQQKKDGYNEIIEKKKIKQQEVFLWRAGSKINLNELQLPIQKISVEFYQKRYHNYPIKQNQTLIYNIVDNKIQEQQIQIPNNIFISQPKKISEKTLRRPQEQGPLNITMIDHEKLAFYDQSAGRTIRKSETEQIPQMGKTQPLITSKKQKVMQFYRQQLVKKQAQRDVKQSTLAGIRDKARQQKILNSTLRSLKEAQRTQALRNKVQRIKQIKSKGSRQEEQDFVQQNNFVMEQQLKMVIMRGRMKQAQGRREEFLSKKSSLERRSSKMSASVQSRKSSRQKARVQIDLRLEQNISGDATGEEGSVVNKRRNKKGRGQSVGAYLRDPSFVHGVFPEEYYPIESRGTSFYFPPVV